MTQYEQGVPVFDLSFDHKDQFLYLQFTNPDHELIKEELKEYIINNLNSTAKGLCKITSFNLHHGDIPDCLKKVLQFTFDCMPCVATNYAAGVNAELKRPWKPEELDKAPSMNFNMERFYLAECWGVVYKEGQGVITHNHFPYCLSFSYNVYDPKGAAPLVLDVQGGKQKIIKAKEGVATFFLASQFHKVQPKDQEAKDRCTLVGNIGYG